MNRGSYRSINSVMLDTKEFKSLSARARHVFLTLKTSRLNNVAGIFIFDVGARSTIADQCGYQSIDKEIAELELARWVLVDDGLIWIRNHLKFEPNIKLDSDEKHKKGVLNVLGGLYDSPLVGMFCTYYNLINPFGGPSIPLRCKEKETEKEKEKETTLSPSGDHRAFIDYWMLQFREKVGTDYIFLGGKDGALVKRVLRELGSLDKAMQYAHEFFFGGDKWVEENGGYTIGVFHSQINKIAQRLAKGKSAGDTTSKYDGVTING